jgi:hypothetical protein
MTAKEIFLNASQFIKQTEYEIHCTSIAYILGHAPLGDVENRLLWYLNITGLTDIAEKYHG